MNYGIEILQQNPVHLFYRFKWAALHIYNGSVAKVHICRKINHIYHVPFGSLRRKIPYYFKFRSWHCHYTRSISDLRRKSLIVPV